MCQTYMLIIFQSCKCWPFVNKEEIIKTEIKIRLFLYSAVYDSDDVFLKTKYKLQKIKMKCNGFRL